MSALTSTNASRLGVAAAGHDGYDSSEAGVLLARGAGAVAVLAGPVADGPVTGGPLADGQTADGCAPGEDPPASCAVLVLTGAGRWRATLDGYPGIQLSRDAVVAGLLPAVAEGWSWADTLRHAIALGLAADPAGELDLDAYEMFLSGVSVESLP